jgi:hypothetical protein
MDSRHLPPTEKEIHARIRAVNQQMIAAQANSPKRRITPTQRVFLALLFCGLLILVSRRASSPMNEPASSWKRIERKDYRYGYANSDGLVMIEPQFRDASHFRKGHSWAAVRLPDSSGYYLIDSLGRRSPRKFFSISNYVDYTSAVGTIDTLIDSSLAIMDCLINPKGKVVTPLYSQIYQIEEQDLFMVVRGHHGLDSTALFRQMALIDGAGNFHTPWYAHLDNAFEPNGRFVAREVAEDGKSSVEFLIDANGKHLSEDHAQIEVCYFSDVFSYQPLALRDAHNAMGLIDRNGKVRLKPQYESIYWYHDIGCYVAETYHPNGNTFSILLPNCKVVAQGVQHRLTAWADDLIGLSTDSMHFAFFRVQGDSLFQASKVYEREYAAYLMYQDPFFGSFHHYGYFRVRSNGHYGFINNQGVEVVPTIYDSTADKPKDYEEMVRVSKDGASFFINFKGEKTTP